MATNRGKSVNGLESKTHVMGLPGGGIGIVKPSVQIPPSQIWTKTRRSGVLNSAMSFYGGMVEMEYLKAFKPNSMAILVGVDASEKIPHPENGEKIPAPKLAEKSDHPEDADVGECDPGWPPEDI